MSRPSSTRAHLGETAAALVDGELGHTAREAAFGHVARCAGCRAEVEAQRRTKALLAGAAAPPVSDELLGRLQVIGAGTPTGGPLVPTPADRRPPTVSGLRRPAGRPRRTGSRRSRSWAAATGVAATLVLGLSTAFVAGGSPEQGRPITPPVDRYAVEHAATTGGVTFPGSPVGAAVSASFTGSGTP